MRIIQREGTTGVLNRSEEEAERKPYSPFEGQSGKVFRKAMAIAEEQELTDQDRYDLALMVPSVDKDGTGSWKELTEKELRTVLTYLEGFVYVSTIKQLSLKHFKTTEEEFGIHPSK